MSGIPQELIDLFTDEAATRLARLSEQLVRLETTAADGPDRAEVVDSVFRDAHTLKGSAGMMGFRAFAQVAHRMEDLLQGVRDRTREPTPQLTDALLAAVDGLRRHLPSVVAGESDEAALAQLEMQLLAAGEAAAEAAPPAPATADPADPAATSGAVPAAGRPAAAEEGVARVPLARIDAMVRLTGEAAAAHSRLVHALHDRLGDTAELPTEVHSLGTMIRELEARTTQARTVPLATVLEPLRRTVRDIAKEQSKAVRLDVEGEEVELDRGVLDRLSDALIHLVRNAVDHGIEPPVDRVQAGKKAQAVVKVSARQRGRGVEVSVSDDGRGIDLDRVRTASNEPGLSDEEAVERLFQPGFSTAGAVTSVSGRGVGLDVVRAALAPVRGRVDVRTVKGKGTTFVLDVPLTVAAVSSIIVRCDGRQYAITLAAVDGMRPPEPDDTPLGAVLGVPVLHPTATVVLRDGERRRAFSVDEVVARRDTVVKAVGALPAVPIVAGASIDADGRVLVVLDAGALLDAAEHGAFDEPLAAPTVEDPVEQAEDPAPGRRALVVDDDAVAGQVLSSMLTRAGYEVRTAANGLEALDVLRDWPADVALVDVTMPVMDGLTLTRTLRSDPVLRGTAVLMLTSLGSEADRRRGMDAGADGYIVKGAYTEAALVERVAGLLGRDA